MRSRPLLAGFDEARRALEEHQPGRATPPSGSLRDAILALPETARRASLVGLVVEETAAVLQVRDLKSVDTRCGFLDLGLDSLMARELRRRLAARTGLAIPATLIFDHPSIEKSADWLLARLVARDEATSATDAYVREHARNEPLAIVGVGLRMPGGVADLDGLWKVLADGT